MCQPVIGCWLCAWVGIAVAMPSVPPTAPLCFSFEGITETLELRLDEPLFELSDRYERYDDRQVLISSLDFAHVSRSDRGATTTLAFSDPPARWGKSLVATVTLEQTTREVLARLTLYNESERSVVRARFPMIHYPARQRVWYDQLLLSTDTGELIRSVDAIIGSRYGSPRYGGEVIFRYPAKLAMQYAVLFHERRSVYFSAYSTDDSFFDQRVAKHQGLWFSNDFYPFLESGTWRSPPVGFGILAGDWHAAADLYRERMSRHFRPPEFPRWLRETFHGWLQISMKGGNAPPRQPKCLYRELPAEWEKARSLGLDTLHIFSWHRGGMDAFYPDYDPSPYLGPPADLRTAMDTIRARGGHATLYINGRLIDPDSDFVKIRGGAVAYARLENGAEQIEHYTGRDFRVANPASAAYRDQLADTFRRLAYEYRALGAQIDQLACNPAVVNFATAAHGHSTPANGFLPGLEQMLREIRAIYRTADPDFFVWSEGTSERLGKWYEVHQGHGEGQSWTADLCLPEQFLYTFPDFLVTGTAEDMDSLCHTYGQGKPFDVHENRLQEPDFVALLQQLIAVRRAEPAYFLRGRFIDSVGLATGTPGVRVWGIEREHQAGGGGLLVNLWAQGAPLSAGTDAWLRHPRPGWVPRAIFPSSLRIRTDGAWLDLRWSGPVATLAFEPSP